MHELKPCAHCGTQAKVYVCDARGAYFIEPGVEKYLARDKPHYMVMCPKCRIRTDAYLTRRDAFNVWDRRAIND